MSIKERLSPNYAKLETALRAIGYSIESAVADVVDNAIDAGAKNILVRLITKQNKPLDLVVWDDGCGMSSNTLKEAMRFGTDVSSEIGRLGKFGLGLKLASLSQAKELKVVSLKNGSFCGRAWLDEGISNEFTSDVFDSKECRAAIKMVAPDQTWGSAGTLVWWSNLYRVGHNHEDPAAHSQKLLRRLERHLSLHFHRFLGGKLKKLIVINMDIFDGDAGRCGAPMRVSPLDPFGYDQSGHRDFPAKLLVGGDHGKKMIITAHIWPPNSDEPNYRLPGGANNRQGFYFYRNNRLIQGGGWNGIRDPENHFSLARLEVDIASDFDIDISLDVKKAQIHLPISLTQAIMKAKTSSGLEYKKYLSLAEKAYRTRKATESELPLIPSSGLPSKLCDFLHSELRIEATKRHVDLKIEWASFEDDSFFTFDRDDGRLFLNSDYRRQLLHGLQGSSADIPVVKCLIFLILRDAILSQRTGAKSRELIEQLNRILVEAVKYERVE